MSVDLGTAYASPWSEFVQSRTGFSFASTGPKSASPQESSATGYVVIRRGRSLTGLLEMGTSNGSRYPDGEPRPYARSLRAVQERSGLDWGQIANTLGVSRRSVHLWLSGGAVSGVNGQRIASMYRLILQSLASHNGDKEGRRQYLLTPTADSDAPLAVIARAIRRAHPRSAPVLSAYDALESPTNLPDPSLGDLDDRVAVVRLHDNSAGF